MWRFRGRVQVSTIFETSLEVILHFPRLAKYDQEASPWIAKRVRPSRVALVARVSVFVVKGLPWASFSSTFTD